MDPAVRGLIDEVVREWVNGSRVFTAFEITLELKNRGAQVRHREIKSDVHETIERVAGAGYTRTLMDVGAPVDAFVYHPSGAAPAAHQPLTRNDPPRPARTAQPASSPRPTDSTASSPKQASSDGTCHPDDDGNLRLPARFLRQMGQSPGDRVEVRGLAYDEQVQLTGSGPSPSDDTLIIDADGEVVVTSEQLESVGLDGLDSYQVSATTHSICISGW